MKKITFCLFAILGITNFTLAQVSFTSQSIATTGQYSICAVDMNGDYLDDIVSVSATNIQIFYQNLDGTFAETNITTTPADYLPSWSIAAGDLTGNGHNDLLYGGGSGVTFMIANGDGTAYTEVSGPEFVFSQRSNFVDINNDGHLDAFVCHDVAPNVYYINDGLGNLTFNQGGIGDYPSGGHYGSLWVDYNNDGDIDMFMAKCGGEPARRTNQLFKNNGDGTFTNVAVEAGLDDLIQTWSAAVGDFDNDGHMDMLVGASSFADGGHKLMRNNGDGTFSDVTAGSGFDIFNGTSVEHATYDFNNDGYLDIFGNSNSVFINNGDFTFTLVAVPFSGAAVGDFNNDGSLDTFRNGTIFYNTGNANNWITINTQGVQSNLNGIGARIEVYSALGTQIRDVRSGEGFKYMSSLNTHFGIGLDTQIDQIIIRWPSGIVDVIENPQINASFLAIEGEHILGTNDQTISTVSLFPNPTNDQLNIIYKGALIGSIATIYDVSGRSIHSEIIKDNSINVKNLSAGTYFLNLNVEGKSTTLRFIKK